MGAGGAPNTPRHTTPKASAGHNQPHARPPAPAGNTGRGALGLCVCACVGGGGGLACCGRCARAGQGRVPPPLIETTSLERVGALQQAMKPPPAPAANQNHALHVRIDCKARPSVQRRAAFAVWLYGKGKQKKPRAHFGASTQQKQSAPRPPPFPPFCSLTPP